jgi:hypothetical protein
MSIRHTLAFLLVALLASVGFIAVADHSSAATATHPVYMVYGGFAYPEKDYAPGHFVLQYTINGRLWTLDYQSDCTFVEYVSDSGLPSGNEVYWAHQSAPWVCYGSGSVVTTLKLQADGNIVIEDVDQSTGQNVGVVWSAGISHQTDNGTRIWAWNLQPGPCPSQNYATVDYLAPSQRGQYRASLGIC